MVMDAKVSKECRSQCFDLVVKSKDVKDALAFLQAFTKFGIFDETLFDIIMDMLKDVFGESKLKKAIDMIVTSYFESKLLGCLFSEYETKEYKATEKGQHNCVDLVMNLKSSYDAIVVYSALDCAKVLDKDHCYGLRRTLENIFGEKEIFDINVDLLFDVLERIKNKKGENKDAE